MVVVVVVVGLLHFAFDLSFAVAAAVVLVVAAVVAAVVVADGEEIVH